MPRLKILHNKIFKNFSYLTVGNALSQLVSLFAILKVTQILSPDDYGLFSFLSVQGLLILTISGLGIKNIAIRTVARDPLQAKDIVVNGIILKGVAIVIVSLLYAVYNYFLGKLTTEHLFLISFFALFSVLFDSFQEIFYGREKMFIPSLINLIYSFFWLAAVYLIPPEHFTATILFYIFLLLNGAKSILCYIFLRQQKILIGRVNELRKTSRVLLRQSWPYFGLILILLPFTIFSNNFLDINSTLDEVGYFNLSQKLIGPISMVIDLGLIAIFPNISALWIKDKEKFYNYVTIGFKYFMILSLLLCFLFTMFAGEVITLLFSEKYKPAIPVSQLQIWYLFLASVDSLIGTILGAINREKLIFKFGLVKAIFCTPFLYYGSTFGALGLSYGYVLSVAVFMIYLWFMFLKYVKVRISQSGILWASAVVVFLLSYFVSSEWSFINKLALSGVVVGITSVFIFRTYKSQIAGL